MTATTWALPVGGYTTSSHTFSFLDLAYTSTSSLGSQTWSVLDINGDAKLDLIVLTERGTTYDEPYGTGTSRYWKAYLNATTVVTAAALGTAVLVVSLYPNPTTDQVLVESGQALLGQPYTVTDYLGRPVLQGKLTAAKQAISLGSLSSGLYLIQVGGQLPQRLRVVKR